MLITGADYISCLSEVTSSILISHFILNLRQVHLHTSSTSTSTQLPNIRTNQSRGHYDTVVFASVASVVGNLGAPLRYGRGGDAVTRSSDPLAVDFEEARAEAYAAQWEGPQAAEERKLLIHSYVGSMMIHSKNLDLIVF